MFCRLLIALLLVTTPIGTAAAADGDRLDGSNPAAAELSYGRMIRSLPPQRQQLLREAIVQIALEGVVDPNEVELLPEYQRISIITIRTVVAGMTADQIINRAKLSTVKVKVKGS